MNLIVNTLSEINIYRRQVEIIQCATAKMTLSSNRSDGLNVQLFCIFSYGWQHYDRATE